MVHRGPDDSGYYLADDHDRQIGLAHRRLSIIDLSPRGRQPMATTDGKLRIVYNGEVFNYRELRDELETRHGVHFESHTDTEVILYGVRVWGLDVCLRRLRGMYAFALYDAEDRSLTLVRDPLGVKPLYYYQDDGSFVFASEIKAILTVPWVARRLDEAAMFHYLTFANSPAPQTLFDGIFKLEAATVLRLEANGRTRQTRYWDARRFTPTRETGDEQEYIDEIRRLLRQSVKRRMVSDVPFGVFLSGGVDSSLNVALMAEQMSRPVETFSIGIQDDPLNEFEQARVIAQKFGTRHHEIEIDSTAFIDFLPRMAWLQDEPLADPVCVPIYYVSKLAREAGVPVIQVGEGSDEIFAGYEVFHLFDGWRNRLYNAFRSLPSALRSLPHRVLAGKLAPQWTDLLRRARFRQPFFIGNAVAFWDSEKSSLLSAPAGVAASSQVIEDIVASFPRTEHLWEITNIELRNRLPELLLMRVDKMSMANSIETRVPFLDEDLVEFALQIPARLKYRKGVAKYILKKAAEGILPDEIIYRRKRGFCGSATNMLSVRLHAFAKEVVLGSPLIRERFNREYIETLFARAESQARFNNFKIWNLMNLALWHEHWFQQPPRVRPT